ncbi:D-2-hydroxyacid dehydrogenase family protein [Halomonas sp. ML-15]|uniref:D-2-hydroxyacid dehydrogenase family protein n=1 Tax=Halomonas sp. ML-15 TaxID=2773305 RepID=UPI00174641A9|nr:D-2-hydroxyacid dehydrogenase family protein [Halomonas sp. ML-15]MBD3895439.1 D-2-hydroxyacid dehydrogenase family protein [Halomonas sp. ML-15]
MKIAILDDYGHDALRLADWSGLGEIDIFQDTLTDQDALAERLSAYDVLCVMRERTPLPGALLERLPKLKLIVTSGSRNLSIDLDTAARQGITVCGTELRKTTTAELTLGLMLASQRRIVVESNHLRNGQWQQGLGRDLGGLTLGIIGLGKVGQQVSALAKAFGMQVAAWSQNLTPALCDEHGVQHATSLEALLKMSDIVTIHVVLSPRSRGLINREALSLMRPTACLINTSRGPIVDTQALVEALRSQTLGSAAIDVFDQEPLPADDPLRDHDLIDSGRLLLTPHLGYTSEQTFRLFYRQMVEDIHAWQRGEPIRQLD